MISCRRRRTLDDLSSRMIVSWILDLGWSLIRGPRRRGGVSQACLGHPCAPFDFVYQSWHHFKVMMMMLVMMLMVMLMLIMVVMKCQPQYLAVSRAAPSRRTVGRRTGTEISFRNNWYWFDMMIKKMMIKMMTKLKQMMTMTTTTITWASVRSSHLTRTHPGEVRSERGRNLRIYFRNLKMFLETSKCVLEPQNIFCARCPREVY